MARLDQLPAGEKVPEFLNAVIEVPRGERVRYAYDSSLGTFRLLMTLKPGHEYPTDYGFIPSTMSEDGEPLDIFVLTDEPTFPGCVVICRPVGVLHVSDGVVPDYKIIGVPVANHHYDKFKDLNDVDEEMREAIAGIFAIHPEISGIGHQTVTGWGDHEAAKDIIFRAWEGFLV